MIKEFRLLNKISYSKLMMPWSKLMKLAYSLKQQKFHVLLRFLKSPKPKKGNLALEGRTPDMVLANPNQKMTLMIPSFKPVVNIELR